MKHATTLALTCLLSFVGANAAELVVAHVGPFSGPLSTNGLANYDGGKVCIDEVNAAGGVKGNTLKLIREDDQYKPQETVRLIQVVAQRDRPIAFINLLGSANAMAVLKDKVLDDVRIPVVGVTPGADLLRSPGSPWMFHIHASDTVQLKRLLSHFNTIGLNRIAVAYQDIPFGQGGMKYIEELAPSLKLTITARVAIASAADDLTLAAIELRKIKAQVYLMILAPNSEASLHPITHKSPLR